MAQHPRDPKQVRLWGWAAFAVGVLIAAVFVILQQPWHR
jgi:hypothetical protein